MKKAFLIIFILLLKIAAIANYLCIFVVLARRCAIMAGTTII